MGFQNSITGGQGTLERPAIKSQNFAAGVSGWSINRDGSAEFNNLTVRGGTTVGGVFLEYNGTPALGNLAFSIAPNAGTDGYGNHYSSGIVAYKNGLTSDIALQSGRLKIGSAATDFVNSALVYQQLTLGGDLRLTTGTGDSDHVDQVRASLLAGRSSQTTGSAFAPSFNLIDGDLTSDVDQYISGNVIKTNKSGTAAAWQNPAYTANWSGGGAIQGLGSSALQLHLMPDDSLWVMGTATAAAGASNQVMTLPVGYRPISGTPHAQAARDSGGVLTMVEVALTTTGQFFVSAGPAAGDVYSFNFRIPLRNIP